MTLEALHALLRIADQHVVVIVRIVSVAAEMRAQALDAGFGIAADD
ncbi:hypothetical protein OKW41_000545 [Paraburkholderia sp. UCT70]